MKPKPVLIRKFEGTETGRRLLREPPYRQVFFAAASLSVNLLYAFYNGALGIMDRSLWFAAMFAYYLILSVMRFSAVLCGWKRAPSASEDAEIFVAKLCGSLLVLLGFVLAGVVFISLSQDVAVRHHEIVMITIATYTFCKVTAAVIKAVRQRKNTAPLSVVIRTIGYAETAVSLMTLQRSMLISFGPADDTKAPLMNGLTGIAVCLFILLLGIFTVLRSGKEREEPHGTI